MGRLEQFPGAAPMPGMGKVIGGRFPPARAALIAAALLNRHSAHEIGEAIEVLLDVLNLMDPPSDDEPNFCSVSDSLPGDPGDHEPGGDEEAGAYIEWTTMHGSQKRGGQNLLAGREDDEDNDPAEEDDPSGQCDEDGINTMGQGLQQRSGHGPGCEISDPGGDQNDDAEIEQMIDDVPAPAVFSLDHDPFTDRRTHIAEPGPGGSVYFRAKGKLWQGTPLGKGPIGLAPNAGA